MERSKSVWWETLEAVAGALEVSAQDLMPGKPDLAPAPVAPSPAPKPMGQGVSRFATDSGPGASFFAGQGPDDFGQLVATAVQLERQAREFADAMGPVPEIESATDSFRRHFGDQDGLSKLVNDTQRVADHLQQQLAIPAAEVIAAQGEWSKDMGRVVAESTFALQHSHDEFRRMVEMSGGTEELVRQAREAQKAFETVRHFLPSPSELSAMLGSFKR